MRTPIHLLLGVTAAVSSSLPSDNKAKYPSTFQLETLKAAAISFGEATCKEGKSQSCSDYRKYWRDESISTPVPNFSQIHQADLSKVMSSGLGKILIISVGQTFRSGGRLTVKEGTESSVNPQKDATESQLAFARYLHDRFNIAADFIVNTYPSKYCTAADDPNCKLREWYPSGTRIYLNQMLSLRGDTKLRVLRPDAVASMKGYERLINLGISRISNVHDYGAVLFIRADLELKPGFFHYFDLYDRITFGFLVQKASSKLPTNKRPQIGDMIMYVPRQHFIIFKHKGQLKLYHDAYNFYRSNTVGFMINTYHDTNPHRSTNPLYFISNRPRSDKTEDVGYTYDDFDGIWEDDPAYPKLNDEEFVMPKDTSSSWSTRTKIAVGGLLGAGLLKAVSYSWPNQKPVEEKPKPNLPPERIVDTESSTIVLIIVALLMVLLILLILYYLQVFRRDNS